MTKNVKHLYSKPEQSELVRLKERTSSATVTLKLLYQPVYSLALRLCWRKCQKLLLLFLVGKSLDVLHIPSPHYLQRVDVSFLASGAVSGRGHWSRKARPSPSWAPPSSGRSPPPPDHYCCQTPHWGGGGGGWGEGGREGGGGGGGGFWW